MQGSLRNTAFLAVAASLTLWGCSCSHPPAAPDTSGDPVVDPDPNPNPDPVPLTVEAGPNVSVCSGGSVTIGPAPVAGLKYQWAPVKGLSSPTDAQPLAQPDVTTTYELTVTDDIGRIASDSVTITVLELPIARISAQAGGAAAQKICSDKAWTATGADSTAVEPATIQSWDWAFGSETSTQQEVSFSPIASGLTPARLTVTDSNGCSNTAQTDVDVRPLPTVLAGPDRVMGLGSQIMLTPITSGGAEPYTFAWTSADPSCVSSPCIGSASSDVTAISPTASTDFTLSVVDADGCGASDSVHVTVNPPLTANAGSDVSVCAGDPATIGGAATGGADPYTYAWTSSTSCPVPGCLSSASTDSATVTVLTATTFTQTVTDINGATASSNVTVTPYPRPTLGAGADVFLLPGDTANLGAAGTAGVTYAWTCNRTDCLLSDAAISNPTATPTQSTRYTVNASSGGACSATGTQMVWVQLQLTSWPQNGQASWPMSSDIQLQFDQPLDTSSITPSNLILQDALSGASIPITWNYDATNKLLTVHPPAAGTGGYVAGTDYTIFLAGGQNGIRSSDATLPNIFQNDQMIDFTTAIPDTTGPQLAARIPAVNATNVAPNSSVEVTFDEPIDPSTISATSFTLTDSANNTVVAAVTYDLINKTALLSPANSLAYSTTYTVSLGPVKDLSGNSSTFTWTFTTSAVPDVTPPTVTAFSPASGALNVSALTPITVTFNEAILASSLTGSITVTDANGAAVAGTITFNSTTNTATFTPQAALAGSTPFTVTVVGVRDLAGNQMTTPYTSSFTTALRLFADDFELGPSNWNFPAGTQGSTWGLSGTVYKSSSHSLSDSPTTKYLANQTSTAELRDALDVTGLTTVSLAFAVRTRTEKNKDFFWVDYQLDGGAWVTINRPGTSTGWSGNIAWTNVNVPITINGATSLKFRFRLVTNGTKNFDGAFVDDVLVQSP